MRFTLRQLEYFNALADQRNFGRAAQICHVSQPALSVQIRALEETMGGALVERRARDVIVTPLGRNVLELARDVLAGAGRLDRLARDRSGGRQSLSLGLIPTMAPYLLPGVLAALRASDLSLRIQVREARTERLLEGLRSGEIDAAVLALPSGAADMVEEPLFEDRFLLAGSGTRLAGLDIDPARLRPVDLKTAQLMLLEDGHCLTDQALEVCGQDRSSGNINMGASSLATLSRLVAEGFGLTLIPELAAQAESAGVPGMQLWRFPAPEPARIVGLVRRGSTGGADWFDGLAEAVRDVGLKVVTECRSQVARPRGERGAESALGRRGK